MYPAKGAIASELHLMAAIQECKVRDPRAADNSRKAEISPVFK